MFRKGGSWRDRCSATCLGSFSNDSHRPTETSSPIRKSWKVSSSSLPPPPPPMSIWVGVHPRGDGADDAREDATCVYDEASEPGLDDQAGTSGGGAEGGGGRGGVAESDPRGVGLASGSRVGEGERVPRGEEQSGEGGTEGRTLARRDERSGDRLGLLLVLVVVAVVGWDSEADRERVAGGWVRWEWSRRE